MLMSDPGEGAGVGGVVGDERGDALEDDPLVGASGRCGPRRRTSGFAQRQRGSARGCRASASGRRGGGAPSHEGVVHRDCDVERRAPAAVTLGQRVRDALPRKPMRGT